MLQSLKLKEKQSLGVIVSLISSLISSLILYYRNNTKSLLFNPFTQCSTFGSIKTKSPDDNVSSFPFSSSNTTFPFMQIKVAGTFVMRLSINPSARSWIEDTVPHSLLNKVLNDNNLLASWSSLTFIVVITCFFIDKNYSAHTTFRVISLSPKETLYRNAPYPIFTSSNTNILCPSFTFDFSIF